MPVRGLTGTKHPVPEGMTKHRFRYTRFPERALIAQLRGRAKQRDLAFNLTAEDLVIPTHCPVLGIKLSWDGPRMNLPSVDRINNKKGYVRGNIVIVSWRANWLKSDATLSELKRIVEFYGKETGKSTCRKNKESTQKAKSKLFLV